MGTQARRGRHRYMTRGSGALDPPGASTTRAQAQAHQPRTARPMVETETGPRRRVGGPFAFRSLATCLSSPAAQVSGPAGAPSISTHDAPAKAPVPGPSSFRRQMGRLDDGEQAL